MPESFTIERLGSVDWAAAMQVVARAMATQPYAFGLYGEELDDRLRGTTQEYGARLWKSSLLTIGAWMDGRLVGVAVATAPEGCPVCRYDPASRRSSEDTWENTIREQHADQPPHGRLGPVAVEPLLQGRGVGSMLLERVMSEVERGCMLLDCLPKLVPLYERFGFEVVRSFSDPYGPALMLMRRSTRS